MTEALHNILLLMKKPVETFNELKYRRYRHWGLIALTLAAWLIVDIMVKQLYGFRFNTNHADELNILIELSMTIGLFFLFCISNWAICTLSSGEGRFDIQLEPKDKSQLGYIIEFKAGKNLSDTELADSASSAIQQSQSKKYSTDMEYHGIKKIGLFGIAFSGKRVAAKYAEIQLHS